MSFGGLGTPVSDCAHLSLFRVPFDLNGKLFKHLTDELLKQTN